MSGRLPTELEVTGLIRNVQAAGGHAAVLRKGDPDRGSLILVIASRGQIQACLERILDFEGGYEWRESAPNRWGEAEKVSDFLANRARFDPDLWALELDIADPERFIAEKLATG